MYTEITSVEEALKRHKDKIDLAKVEEALSFLPKVKRDGMIGLLTLEIITETVNNDDPAVEDFEADYNNDDQEKWAPLYVGGDSTGAGFRFGGSICGWAYTDAFGGARLALKDEARADHMEKYFQPLYKALYLKLKA